MEEALTTTAGLPASHAAAPPPFDESGFSVTTVLSALSSRVAAGVGTEIVQWNKKNLFSRDKCNDTPHPYDSTLDSDHLSHPRAPPGLRGTRRAPRRPTPPMPGRGGRRRGRGRPLRIPGGTWPRGGRGGPRPGGGPSRLQGRWPAPAAGEGDQSGVVGLTPV